MFSCCLRTRGAFLLSLFLILLPIVTRGEETVFDAGQLDLIDPPWRIPHHLHFAPRCIALIGRKLVELSPDSVGTFATVFPSDHPELPGIAGYPPPYLRSPRSPYSGRSAVLPATVLRKVRRTPAFELYPCAVQLMGCIVIYTSNSCHHNGSLTLLFFPISRHSKNILGSVNHAASLSVASPNPAAWKPRVSLIGSVTLFQDIANTPDEDEIAGCYLKRHPDAVRWLPRDKRQPHIVRPGSQQLFLGPLQLSTSLITIH